MRHITHVSQRRPREARAYQDILTAVGFLNTILSFVVFVAETFGIPLPQKENDDEEGQE